MAKGDGHRIESASATTSVEQENPFADTLLQTHGRRSEQQPKQSDAQAYKAFAEDQKVRDRDQAHVESGHVRFMPEKDGKPLASSETLLRAESKEIYDALNGKSEHMRGLALKRLGIDKDGNVLKPQDGDATQVDMKSREGVYQAYLTAMRNDIPGMKSRNPQDLEDARLRKQYQDQKSGKKMPIDYD